MVTAWGGAVPRGEGVPAVIDGFVFPLALPQGAPAVYRDSFREPGPVDCDGTRLQCAVTIATAPGAHAVAAVAGVLRGATPADREEGIAFWVESAGGDRLGYGALVSYAPGVGEGARGHRRAAPRHRLGAPAAGVDPGRRAGQPLPAAGGDPAPGLTGPASRREPRSASDRVSRRADEEVPAP